MGAISATRDFLFRSCPYCLYGPPVDPSPDGPNHPEEDDACNCAICQDNAIKFHNIDNPF